MGQVLLEIGGRAASPGLHHVGPEGPPKKHWMWKQKNLTLDQFEAVASATNGHNCHPAILLGKRE